MKVSLRTKTLSLTPLMLLTEPFPAIISNEVTGTHFSITVRCWSTLLSISIRWFILTMNQHWKMKMLSDQQVISSKN